MEAKGEAQRCCAPTKRDGEVPGQDRDAKNAKLAATRGYAAWAITRSRREEADDDAGGDPIVVLMKIRSAERGPVVVRIEQTDVNVPEWVDIQPAADFEREAVLGSM